MADDETSLFRTSWSLYDAICDKNYMFHREIYAHVSDLLRQRHQRGAFSLLDLGCGNTRFLAPCLHRTPPGRYDGVDLSAVALDEARGHLHGLHNVTLRQQDMLQAVEEADTAFDLIFSSFAVHHLGADEKQRLFNACAAKLVPGGQFIMIDVVREDCQSREQYLDGYLNFMRTRWTAVPPDQINEACDHVAAFDFPETVAGLRRMAAAASFQETRLVDRYAQHHVLVFST